MCCSFIHSIELGSRCEKQESCRWKLYISTNRVVCEELLAGSFVEEFYGRSPFVHRIMVSWNDFLRLGDDSSLDAACNALKTALHAGALFGDVLDYLDACGIPFVYGVVSAAHNN